MNLDRFDGYPGGEEQRQRKPTALDKWMALGFDPVEEVGEVDGYIHLNAALCVKVFERKEIASSDATKGLSDQLA